MYDTLALNRTLSNYYYQRHGMKFGHYDYSYSYEFLRIIMEAGNATWLAYM